MLKLHIAEFHGMVYRHTAIVQPPLDMLLNAARGGRFNPPISFPMLYTSLTVQGAKAEFIKSAETFKVTPVSLLPRMLHRIEVDMRKVVDLTDVANRKFLGCSRADLIGDDWTVTQKIGTQLRNLCDAILSYSAADPKHQNLNLYIINPKSVAVVGSTKIQTMADWDEIKSVK